MRKLFTFLCATLMSVGMFAETTVTFTKSEIAGASGNSFTKGGVTMTVGGVEKIGTDVAFTGGSISFTTTTELAFVKIEVKQEPEAEKGNISGDGWSGTTCEGNATSVSGSCHQGSNNELWDIEQVICTLDEPAQVTTYTLQLVADPTKGSVAVTNLLGSDIVDNGNGNYTVPENAEVTILATPNEGFAFKGWKYGNLKDPLYRDTLFIVLGHDTLISGLEETYELTIIMKNNFIIMADFEEAQPQETVVTITEADYVSGNTITKDGVTLTVKEIAGVGSWYVEGPGTFTNTIGNFTKIEVTTVGGSVYIEGDGWTGDIGKMTWTGNAPTVSFTNDIFGKGEGFSIVCTIEPASEEGIENIVLTEGAKKVVVDGMLLIERDGKLFNAQGAEVK